MLLLGLSKVWHRLRKRKEDNLKIITTPLFGIYPQEIIRFRERSQIWEYDTYFVIKFQFKTLKRHSYHFTVLGLFSFSLRLRKRSANIPCPSSSIADSLKVPFAAKQQIPQYPTLDHVAELAGSKGNLQVRARGEIHEWELEHLSRKSM